MNYALRKASPKASIRRPSSADFARSSSSSRLSSWVAVPLPTRGEQDGVDGAGDRRRARERAKLSSDGDEMSVPEFLPPHISLDDYERWCILTSLCPIRCTARIVAASTADAVTIHRGHSLERSGAYRRAVELNCSMVGHCQRNVTTRRPLTRKGRKILTSTNFCCGGRRARLGRQPKTLPEAGSSSLQRSLSAVSP